MTKSLKKQKSPKKNNRKAFPPIVNGVRDYMSDELILREKIRNSLRSVASFYGFNEFEPSYIEEKGIYDKYYDVVMQDTKMFFGELIPKKKIALRPDMLPGIMRAYTQDKSMRLRPTKLWYFGNVFSANNLINKDGIRQMTQGGVLILNTIDPAYDVQVLAIMNHFADELKLGNTTLRINSAGCSVCRKQFIKKMRNYYKNNEGDICNKCVSSYKENPLSLFKCTNELCKKSKVMAPIILDSLCENCKKHFSSILELLDEMSVTYSVDPFLVRPQLFWSKIIFELVDGDNRVLMSGGRMNDLSKHMSGPKIAMTGFSFSVENLISNFRNKTNKNNKQAKIVFIYVGEKAKIRVMSLMEMFYDKRMKVKEVLGDVSLKKQLSVAKNIGASIALIVGQKEVFDETIILRSLRTGAQEIVSSKNIIKKVKSVLASKKNN